MAKVVCVLYDDPVDGYPTSYARDALPKIHHYPSLDFSNASVWRRRTGQLSGNSVVPSIGLGGYLTRFASRASGNFRPPVMRVHQGALQHGDEQAWCVRCVV
jgi:hypothetical protein